MKVFINEKKVRIMKHSDKLDNSNYDLCLEGGDPIVSSLLQGKILVKKAELVQMMDLIKIMEKKNLPLLESVIFTFEKKKKAEKYFKEHFEIIEAAGGIVEKEDDILMMFRRKKWDLPKGKLEKDETREEGAKREVEEECNVKVKVKDKIGTTYHTYVHKEKRILKKTYWYAMDIVSDKRMKPQLEEDIELVKWMNNKEVKEALKNSFKSIEEIIKKYRFKKEESKLN